MTISRPVWRAIALVTAAVFFWLATRTDVDRATSPHSLSHTLFGTDFAQFAHPAWLSLHIFVRKAYSIIAFTVVGFTAGRALGPTARPGLRAVLIVSAYSLGIEIAQRLFVASEPNLESLLDVACGALGGWLAVLTERALSDAERARGCSAPRRPPAASVPR